MKENEGIPFSEYVDLIYKINGKAAINYRNLMIIFLVRLIQAANIVGKTYHPDEYYQGVEIAYKMAYMDQVDILTTWEWTQLYSLRNTLYPAYLSIPLLFFRKINLDYNFVVVFSPVFMNSLIIVLGDYYSFRFTETFINKKCALIFIIYSLFNKNINEIFGRTMTNGAEAVFCMIAFYYYFNLKYADFNISKNQYFLFFEKNMALMTFSITMAFLVRSSSIIGWVPLALIYILSSSSFVCMLLNLFAIAKAGVFVALPMIVISIAIDSFYYGKVAFPQFNFAYVNVVQNISLYFGYEPYLFYFRDYQDASNVIDRGLVQLFGISMITIYQVRKKLTFQQTQKNQIVQYPIFLLYIIVNYIVLCRLEHKEQRFLSSLFLPMAISWAFAVQKLVQILPFHLRNKTLRFILIVYSIVQSIAQIEKSVSVRFGEKELFTVISQNSSLLLDYSDFLQKNNQTLDFKGLNQVESIFHQKTHDSPFKAWIHQRGSKITGLNYCQEFPGFFLRRYFYNFKNLEYKYKGLKLLHEPYGENSKQGMQFYLIIKQMFDQNEKIPQFLIVNFKPEIMKLIEESGCYELIYKNYYWMRPQRHTYVNKYIFRITPQCSHRIIKRDYFRNSENLSLSKSCDFEFAYQNFQSPMYEDVQSIIENINY